MKYYVRNISYWYECGVNTLIIITSCDIPKYKFKVYGILVEASREKNIHTDTERNFFTTSVRLIEYT